MVLRVLKRWVVILAVVAALWYLFIQLMGMKAEYKDGFSDLPLGICVSYAMKKQQLTDLSQLKTLSCQKKGIKSLEGIDQLTGLEALYLQGNDLVSLEGMGTMPSLKVISVAANKQLTSLEGLQGAINLEELQANLSSNLQDISAVERLVELRILAAMQDKISDISALGPLDKLEEVILSYNQIADISALGNKPRLERLQIYSNPLQSITPLLGNSQMTLVGIGGKKREKQHLCAALSQLKSQLSEDAVVYGPEACGA